VPVRAPRVVAFNTAEKWSSDVSEDVAWEVLKRVSTQGFFQQALSKAPAPPASEAEKGSQAKEHAMSQTLNTSIGPDHQQRIDRWAADWRIMWRQLGADPGQIENHSNLADKMIVRHDISRLNE
jgi:hypothetical protein